MSQIPPPPPPNWQLQQTPLPPYAGPTYNQAPPQYALPAGFWVRVGAYFIDSIIISVPLWTVIGIGAALLTPGFNAPSETEQYNAAILAFALILLLGLIMLFGLWLYEAIMTSSERGATVGKRALGLRVLKGDGTQLTFGRATGRFFAKAFITGMIPFGIGYIMAGFTDRKRALHDMIADTIVIKV